MKSKCDGEQENYSYIHIETFIKLSSGERKDERENSLEKVHELATTYPEEGNVSEYM